jgi:hypothetical protein
MFFFKKNNLTLPRIECSTYKLHNFRGIATAKANCCRSMHIKLIFTQSLFAEKFTNTLWNKNGNVQYTTKTETNERTNL